VLHLPCGRIRIENANLSIGFVDQLGCDPIFVDHCDIRHDQIEAFDIIIARKTVQSDEVAFVLLCIDTSKDYTAVTTKVGQIKTVETRSDLSSIDKSLDKIWVADSHIAGTGFPDGITKA
jgi:hypothetical protein